MEIRPSEREFLAVIGGRGGKIAASNMTEEERRARGRKAAAARLARKRGEVVPESKPPTGRELRLAFGVTFAALEAIAADASAPDTLRAAAQAALADERVRRVLPPK